MTIKGMPLPRTEEVRVGLAGCGGRGMSLLRDLLAIEGARVTAVFDVSSERAEAARVAVEQAGSPPPTVYEGDEESYRRLCDRDDLDLVYVVTPWKWHVPMAVTAMEAGKHVAVEVPAATTLEDCWRLVETSQRTRRHCVLLENCCYGYEEMLVLNLVRAGHLGDLTHAEAAYIHDLRSVLLAEEGEGLWRREPHTRLDGNLYPTHGLGPVARCLEIPERDRFTFLVSVSSREAGLTAYRDAHTSPGDPRRDEVYRCGDMNISILKTEQGKTVILQHDIVSPRPYDRINLVSGTKGAFRGYPARIYLDGQQEGGGHDWQTLDAFKDQYEDPLWKAVGELARRRGGHGGMDFLMNYRLIECFHQGLPPAIDVYDAAIWSAPGPLSELSVSQGSAPVPFPDFLRAPEIRK